MQTENSKDGQPTKKVQHVKRRGILKGGIVAAIASAFSLVPFSPANAASQSSSNGPKNINITSLSGAEAEKYIHLVVESQDYQRFKGNTQKDHAQIFAIQELKIEAMAINVDNQAYVAVRVPVVGGAGHSFYVATFVRGHSTILSTTSVLGMDLPDHNVHAIAERNGKIAFDGIIANNGKILHGTLYTLNGPQTLENIGPEGISSFFACLLRCLAGLGVAGWILGLVSALCALLCLFDTVACVNCVVDGLGGLGVEVAYCAAKCI
jgi:hypothetical protein